MGRASRYSTRKMTAMKKMKTAHAIAQVRMTLKPTYYRHQMIRIDFADAVTPPEAARRRQNSRSCLVRMPSLLEHREGE